MSAPALLQLSRRDVFALGGAAGAAYFGMLRRATAAEQQGAVSDTVSLDAVALADAIRTRRVACVEVMRAYLDQISRLNSAVNAIVALQDRDRLLAEARERDEQLSRGLYLGPLHGFPQAIKDLERTAGVRTTFGSPLFKDFVPQSDEIVVARMRRAGAIVIGKTNVPEFGLGSQSYNQVYGTTLNAYDQSKAAGGSSGGAAVAVSLRMMAVADGSDYGGSLRNPAAWNNVFGFRTSPGSVPSTGDDAFRQSMGVFGPIARTVPDLALLLAVQAGHDPQSALSLVTDPRQITQPLSRDFKGVRVAWAGDFGGYLPFEPGVLELCRASLTAFEQIGCVVEEAAPDYPIEQVWPNFVTLRAGDVAAGLIDLYRDPAKRAALKPEAIWEIERGMKLSALDVSRASAARTAWFQAVRRLFERYDYWLLPAGQVFPFDATTHWPAEINGRPMDSYHRWMEVMSFATMAGSPALAVPAGFGANSLPMGLQILGPREGELSCLQLAFAYDQATGWVNKRPPPLLRR